MEEKEIFKICLEYWNALAADLYRENPFSTSHSPLMLSQQSMPPRRQLYLPVLSKVHAYKTLKKGLFIHCLSKSVHACHYSFIPPHHHHFLLSSLPLLPPLSIPTSLPCPPSFTTLLPSILPFCPSYLSLLSLPRSLPSPPPPPPPPFPSLPPSL